MVDRKIADVSEILDAFNTSEIKKMVDEQIPLESTEARGMVVDYYTPLYYQYRNSIRDADEEEVIDLIKSKFFEINNIFTERIGNKFNIGLDDGYLETHGDKYTVITMALYTTFVINFVRNIHDALSSYIQRHKEELSDIFKEVKNKKDTQTMINKKIMSDEDVIIASNIYDIAQYVFENIDEEYFLELIDDGDACTTIVRELYADGTLCGGFMEPIRAIFTNDISLRSTVCFDIVCDMKSNHINVMEGKSDGAEDGSN